MANEDKYDEPASSYEAEMLDNQIAFIKYAADEIKDAVHDGGVFPEWFQNKLSGVHDKMKSLHAYMEGERQQEKEKARMIAMKDVKDDYFESLEEKLSVVKEAEKRWKQTSMSPEEATKKYGKENVKVKKGALRNGDDMVEVFVESAQTMTEEQFDEAAGEKDACYHKVKSRYKVWPSAYASGALVQCRKVGAKNWGNKSK